MKSQDVTDYLLAGCRCPRCVERTLTFDMRPTKVKQRQWPIDLAIIVAIGTVIFLVAFAVLAFAEDGTLQVLHFDKIGGRSEHVYKLHTPTSTLTLQMPKRTARWKTGSRVRVTGRSTPAGIEVASVQALSAAPTPATFGPHRVAVVLFNFLDNRTQPWTVTQIQNVLSTVNAFYAENSFGHTSLSADVYGYYTSTFAVQGDCGNAVAAVDETLPPSLDLSAYQHIVQVFPHVNCWWDGFAEIGGKHVWINGNLYPGIVAHELGHNFGLYHSHSLSCVVVACLVSEYGDVYDTMGGLAGHFNSGQKEDLGWLIAREASKLMPRKTPMPPLRHITAPDGLYWIGPYEAQNRDPKGLKIATQGGYYYVEQRMGMGFDAAVGSGVLMHFVDESVPDGNYLMDVDLTNGVDFTLNVGTAYTDGKVTVTVMSSNSTGAMVHVRQQ